MSGASDSDHNMLCAYSYIRPHVVVRSWRAWRILVRRSFCREAPKARRNPERRSRPTLCFGNSSFRRTAATPIRASAPNVTRTPTSPTAGTSLRTKRGMSPHMTARTPSATAAVTGDRSDIRRCYGANRRYVPGGSSRWTAYVHSHNASGARASPRPPFGQSSI